MYKHEFKSAMERTLQFGLSLPVVEFEKSTVLTPDNWKKMNHIVEEYFSNLNVMDVATHCLPVHLDVMSLFHEHNIPCVFTLGYVFHEGKKRHFMTESELKTICERGVDGTTVNIHAWLTLPSMEVIDLTYWTTFSYATNNSERLGELVIQSDDEELEVVYHPLLIGEDWLYKSGILVSL